MMNDSEKEALQYRFQGYQLFKIQMDAGFDSYYVGVHPYYFNQPLSWTKPTSVGISLSECHIIEANYPTYDSGYRNESSRSSSTSGTSGASGASQSSGQIKMMNF